MAEKIIKSQRTKPQGRKSLQDLKDFWSNALDSTQKTFSQTVNGIQAGCTLATYTDTLISTLYEKATGKHPSAKFCIIAVGGYGMGIQAPCSDIDIVFLCEDINKCKDSIEGILYALWDIGSKIGQNIHTPSTVLQDIKNDTVFLTSVMTSHFICGDKEVYEVFQQTLENTVYPHKVHNFVQTKMKEREDRHKHFGDSRYILEPNVKEGKGGLRDLQTLLWIGKYVYRIEKSQDFLKKTIFTQEEQKSFDKAYAFLWSVRFALHCTSKCRNNTLTFPMQREVARMLGYKDDTSRSVETFMQDYFSTLTIASGLTRAFMAYFENTHKGVAHKVKTLDNKDFVLLNDRLQVRDTTLFVKNPLKILEVFSLMEKEGYKAHPHTLTSLKRSMPYVGTTLRNDLDANTAFVNIVAGKKNPERILRLMNEVGFLETFIPEWKKITCQMQYNMYHSFTTDEHTIQAIGLLSKVEQNRFKAEHPLCTKILSKSLDRKILYVSVLLHDIGKGGQGDHSILGANIAQKLCPRFGFNDTDTQTIAWLVEHHLTFSIIAQRRDITDPKTIRDFAKEVKSVSMLDMLTVLTVVDTRAVGPAVWTTWKAELIRTLYKATHNMLAGQNSESVVQQQILDSKNRVKRSLENINSTKQQKKRLEYFLQSVTPAYILSASPKSLAWQIDSIVNSSGKCIKIRHNEYTNNTEILLQLPDYTELVSDLAGVMAILGVSVVEAKIHILGTFGAITMFHVNGHNGGFAKLNVDKVKRTLDKVLQNTTNIKEEITKKLSSLKQKHDAFTITGRITVDNDSSHTNTLIEIETKDRVGLLYLLSKALVDLGLKIRMAKISTYGERVVDVFYVKDMFGLKLYKDQIQKTVQTTLQETLRKEL